MIATGLLLFLTFSLTAAIFTKSDHTATQLTKISDVLRNPTDHPEALFENQSGVTRHTGKTYLKDIIYFMAPGEKSLSKNHYWIFVIVCC